MTPLRLLVFAPLFASVALAQTKPDVKSELNAAYQKWVNAFQRKDVAGVKSLLVEDFTWILHDGKELNLKDAELAIKSQFDSIQNGRWLFKVNGVMGSGSIANTTVEYSFSGTMTDAGKQPYQVKITGVERHVWYKTDDGWKQKRAEVLNLTSKSGPNTVSSADIEGPPPPGWISADPPRPGDGQPSPPAGGGG